MHTFLFQKFGEFKTSEGRATHFAILRFTLFTFIFGTEHKVVITENEQNQINKQTNKYRINN